MLCFFSPGYCGRESRDPQIPFQQCPYTSSASLKSPPSSEKPSYESWSKLLKGGYNYRGLYRGLLWGILKGIPGVLTIAHISQWAIPKMQPSNQFPCGSRGNRKVMVMVTTVNGMVVEIVMWKTKRVGVSFGLSRSCIAASDFVQIDA